MAKDGKTYRTELDLDGLLRMDEGALTDVLVKQVGSAITKPDEARKRLNLPPEAGGNALYLQQQNYSLAALAKRDAGPDPFGAAKPEPAPMPEPVDPTKALGEMIEAATLRIEQNVAAQIKAAQPEQKQADEMKAFSEMLIRGLELETVDG
jgi:hypothetical protein